MCREGIILSLRIDSHVPRCGTYSGIIPRHFDRVYDCRKIISRHSVAHGNTRAAMVLVFAHAGDTRRIDSRLFRAAPESCRKRPRPFPFDQNRC